MKDPNVFSLVCMSIMGGGEFISHDVPETGRKEGFTSRQKDQMGRKPPEEPVFFIIVLKVVEYGISNYTH